MKPFTAMIRSRGLVKGLQDRAARALPAVIEQNRYGCLLRHSDSSMWWVGAALMHGPALGVELPARIAAIEDFYASHGQAARVQVCPACPAGLDAALAGRGYQRGPEMSLQVATASQVVGRLPTAPLHLDVADRPDPAWLALWMAVQAPDADPEPEWRLLGRVNRTSGYVTVVAAGQPVAVGRAVVDRGWAGLFGMGTLPSARRQRAGSTLLVALARWALQHGAPRMYLQVEQDNGAAARLYARAGFRPLCGYHYRTAAASSITPGSNRGRRG